MLQNKLTRAQYLDEVTWTTKSWLGLQKQRISVVLHTAIAEQIVNELANGEGGRVHGAKCLAVLAFAVRGTLFCSLLEGRSSSKRTVLTHDCRWSRSPLAPRSA